MISEAMPAQAVMPLPNAPAKRDDTAWWLLAVLGLTIAVALLWSHQKLLWFDELLELQTDGVGSAREVLAIQRHVPISLDPAAYHLITHFSTRVLGVTALGVRFPALCGFVLLQVCLFSFARRIAGTLAGVLAAGLPALSGTLLYSVEARPYGLLMGLYGLVLVSYQTAARKPGARRLALTGLAAGIALTINLHYFGVLVLVPLCIAEVVRTVQRRQMDLPLAGALALGAAGIALVLPFYPATARYGLHYYADGTVTPHTLTLCYRVLFLSDKQFGSSMQRAVMTLLVLGMATLFARFILLRRRRQIDVPLNELVLMLCIAALPFFGYMLAVAATHTMAIRYVFPAVFGFSVVIACSVSPLLHGRAWRIASVVILLSAIAGMGAFHIRREVVHRAKVMQDLLVPEDIRQTLVSAADSHLYMLNVFPYEAHARYEPDPEIRRRLTLLYSYGKELELRHRDTNALTADHMRVFTGFPITSWEQMRATDERLGPVPHYLVLTEDEWWDWGRDALAQEGAEVRTLGKALGGTIVEVRWRPPASPVHAEGALPANPLHASHAAVDR